MDLYDKIYSMAKDIDFGESFSKEIASAFATLASLTEYKEFEVEDDLYLKFSNPLFSSRTLVARKNMYGVKDIAEDYECLYGIRFKYPTANSDGYIVINITAFFELSMSNVDDLLSFINELIACLQEPIEFDEDFKQLKGIKLINDIAENALSATLNLEYAEDFAKDIIKNYPELGLTTNPGAWNNRIPDELYWAIKDSITIENFEVKIDTPSAIELYKVYKSLPDDAEELRDHIYEK